MAEAANPNSDSGTSVAPKPPAAAPATRTAPRPANRLDKLPPYNVVLLDDDAHSVAYVVEMLKALFGHPNERGQVLAKEVNDEGRAVVFTTHKEMAELKSEQIGAYGKDPRVASCKGSMSSIVEPVLG